jgi:hypothetical protein
MTSAFDPHYYAGLQRDLDEALSLAKSVLSASGHSEVREYIDVGEYGLALERLSEIIEESGAAPGLELLAILSKVRKTMRKTDGL